MITTALVALGLIDGAGGAPVTPVVQDTIPGGLDFLGPRRIKVRKEDAERLIEKIDQDADTIEERKAAVRASLELSKTQPAIDLDAPWVQDFIRAVLMEYMAEQHEMQRQKDEDEALILLLM